VPAGKGSAMNGQAISAAFHTVRHRNTCVQFLVYPKKPLMIHACGRSTGSFTRGPHCILFEPCGVSGNEESFTLDDNGALDPSGCRQDACPPLLISRASLQLWATELTSRVSLEEFAECIRHSLRGRALPRLRPRSKQCNNANLHALLPITS
jgi:hypothetical protein